MKFTTRLIHPDRIRLADDNLPVNSPIYLSSKFTFKRLAEVRRLLKGKRSGYLYSRVTNPTVHELESQLATLQGCEAGVAFASGVAAISNVLLALLKSGDHVVMFYESYKPTRFLVRRFLSKFGISSTIVSVRDRDGFIKAFLPGKTKLVLAESPSNPTLAIADVDFIGEVTRAAGARLVLDNTFAGLHNHHGYPVDLYIHSLSKYAGGHGDVVAGAVLGKRTLIEEIRWATRDLGASLDAHVAYLVMRGLQTYSLRYGAQSANAMKLAKYLSKHQFVTNVRYPGLESHPEFALALKQIPDFGTVVTFDLTADGPTLDYFADRLKLVRLTGSLGSTESLIAPVELFYGGELSEAEKRLVGINEKTVRLSAGIEDIDDLISDLNFALSGK